jgi:hypothetical protein
VLEKKRERSNKSVKKGDSLDESIMDDIMQQEFEEEMRKEDNKKKGNKKKVKEVKENNGVPVLDCIVCKDQSRCIHTNMEKAMFKNRPAIKTAAEEVMDQVLSEKVTNMSEDIKVDEGYIPSYWDYMEKPYNWYKTIINRGINHNVIILGDRLVSRYGIGNNIMVNLVDQNGDYIVDFRRMYNGIPTKLGIQISYNNLLYIMGKFNTEMIGVKFDILKK